MLILIRLVDDVAAEMTDKTNKKMTEDMQAVLTAISLQCDAFRALLSVMSKHGNDHAEWAHTYDMESQRMLLNDRIGDLPWPMWMKQPLMPSTKL